MYDARARGKHFFNLFFSNKAQILNLDPYCIKLNFWHYLYIYNFGQRIFFLALHEVNPFDCLPLYC